MKGGFQICFQNLNRTTFEPLFGKKSIENWKNPVSTFFGPKGGQMMFDLNFETRYEILSSFPDYMTPFCKNYQFLNFWSLHVIEKFQMARAINFFPRI